MLVFNQTKVIPARLELKKETGGKVEILILENKGGTLKILADRKLSGSTDLFIQEGYKFKFIDDLITNFHVPKSSLLMLVSSLTGRKKLLEVYSRAIKHNFRLFSFGDGMLIV